MEEDLSSLRVDARYINQQLASSSSKEEFEQKMRTMMISQLIQN